MEEYTLSSLSHQFRGLGRMVIMPVLQQLCNADVFCYYVFLCILLFLGLDATDCLDS